MKNYDKDLYTSINSETWDEWAENGCEWTIPVTHDEFLSAKESGKVRVYLTPCVTVPDEWLGDLRGKRLLGLASGGGGLHRVRLFGQSARKGKDHVGA